MVTNVLSSIKFFSCSLNISLTKTHMQECIKALVSRQGKAPYDTCILPESYEGQVIITQWQTSQLQHLLETAGHFPHKYKEITFLKELVGRKMTNKPCVHMPTSILWKTVHEKSCVSEFVVFKKEQEAKSTWLTTSTETLYYPLRPQERIFKWQWRDSTDTGHVTVTT